MARKWNDPPLVRNFLKQVSKDDWQYLLPFCVCVSCFVVTDILNLLEKINLAYWSGALTLQPYRIITSHFLHVDIKHLLANTFGIIVARYCLQSLRLKSNFFFGLVVVLLIPMQTLILWILDIFLFKNPMSLAIGFSGILYGVDAFVLLASRFQTQPFANFELLVSRQKNPGHLQIEAQCLAF